MTTAASSRQSVSRYALALLITAGLLGNSSPGVARGVSNQDAADLFGGILGLIISAAMIDAAKKSWRRVETDVQNCLVNKFNINPAQLVQNGIKANDSRVVPYIQACRQALAAAQQQQAYEAAQRQAALEAQQRAEEEARAEAQRQAAADVARRAAAHDERVKNLKSRFPGTWVAMILDRKVDLGWSREAVREALGEPNQMMRTPDGTEMWAYGARRVIFTNGKVTYVGA